MNYTTELIDQYKARLKIPSDYAAAKALGVSQSAMSNYRNSVSHADDRVCIVLAEALDLDPLQTIARVNVDRSRTEKDKAFWRKYSSAAAVLLSIISVVYNAPMHASAPSRLQSHILDEYILCQIMVAIELEDVSGRRKINRRSDEIIADNR